MGWGSGTRAQVKEWGLGRYNRGYGGESGDAGGGAEDSSGETGGSGGRAVALDGGTVDSGSAAGIWDRQPGTRTDVMETRADGWGSRRRNREFSSGAGGLSDETRGSDMDQDVRSLKIGTRAGKPRTQAVE